MNCPKCGFTQPDDIYCVLCGVNIERYARKRRKRRYKVFMLIALIGIGVLSAAKYINYVHHAETPQREDKDGYYGPKAQRQGSAASRVTQHRGLSGRQLYSKGKADLTSLAQSQKQTPRPDRSQDEPSGKGAPVAGAQPGEQSADLGHEQEAGTLTARQWFEKGAALDDDSDAEIQFYQKAMELDPEFVPAHYRLGGIYYRQAKYDLADQEFAVFLKHASEADREAYDIYVYYSLTDVERLHEVKVKGQGPAEEAEKETSSEAEKEKQEASGEESGLETGEEVMTIVKFSSIDGHVVVPIVLNGFLKASMLVDTGAGITVISRELAHELRLEADLGNPITLKTMAMDIQAQSARLDSIQVGGLSRDNFPVAITDLPFGGKARFDGILGMDFMNNYKIQIDNKNRQILFTPNAG